MLQDSVASTTLGNPFPADEHSFLFGIMLLIITRRGLGAKKLSGFQETGLKLGNSWTCLSRINWTVISIVSRTFAENTQ